MQTTDGSGFPINTSRNYSSSSTQYIPFWGTCDNFSTESDTNYLVPIALDLDNLSSYIYTNSSTSTTTIKLRVDGVDGNQSIAVGSGVTGALQDTSNSDSISADDLVNYSVTGANATISISSVTIFATPPAAGGYANTVNGVLAANMSKVNAVAKANISKVMGA